MKKISFPNIDKKIKPIPLQQKIGTDTLIQESKVMNDRMTYLAYYYNHLTLISSSKKGSGTKSLNTSQIEAIFTVIFNRKPNTGEEKKKNNMIDKILSFFENEYLAETNSLDVVVVENKQNKEEEYSDDEFERIE